MNNNIQIYDYLNVDHLKELCIRLRNNPYSEEKFYMFLDDNTCIYDYAQYCLLNALIASTLDSYNIFDRRDEFVYFESYEKGVPVKYMERIMAILLEMKIPDEEFMLAHVLSSIKGCFHLPTVVVDSIVSLDHSIDDYLDAYEESDEFRDMMDNPKVSANENPYDAYEKVKTLPDKFKDSIYIKPLTNLKRAGVKVNDKQIMQNIYWSFVPSVIDPSEMSDYFITEGCLTGYSKFESYYIDQKVGRKAVLTTKSEVQQVGATSKQSGTSLMYVTMNEPQTREYMEDCGSTRHLKVYIKDKNDLKYHRYAYFKLPNGEYDYIDKNRYDLIGKTLEIRSMMLCDHPFHVCEKCFGHFSKFNRDTKITKFNFSIATLVALAVKLQGVKGMAPLF